MSESTKAVPTETPEQVIAHINAQRQCSRPGMVYPDLPTREELQGLIDSGVSLSEIMSRCHISRKTLDRLIGAYGITRVVRRQKRPRKALPEVPSDPPSRTFSEALGMDPELAPIRTREEILAAKGHQGNVVPIRPQTPPATAKSPLERLRYLLERGALINLVNAGKTSREIAMAYRTDDATLATLAGEYGIQFGETPPPVKARQVEAMQARLTESRLTEDAAPGPRYNTGTLLLIERKQTPACQVAGLLRGLGETCVALGDLKVRVKVEVWEEPGHTATLNRGPAA